MPSVWFSSADESAAKEYIDYCEKWVKFFHAVAKVRGEMVIDNEKDIKALVIEFSNGTKIHALSSNPKSFRSKGGKVVLDEFAFMGYGGEILRAGNAATVRETTGKSIDELFREVFRCSVRY